MNRTILFPVAPRDILRNAYESNKDHEKEEKNRNE
jgi:hypothetical protein